MASITCKLEFRWAFAVRFHKLGFCLSQFLHHLFVVLFRLPCRLEFRLVLSNGEGVYPTALGYEMFPVYVQNVNRWATMPRACRQHTR